MRRHVAACCGAACLSLELSERGRSLLPPRFLLLLPAHPRLVLCNPTQPSSAMQATLTIQAAPVARVQARRQQVACSAAASQQRAVSVVAPKVGGLTSQRNVAAHAKGAIKPMEATFTDFKLVDKSKKVRRRGRRAAAATPAAAAQPPSRCRKQTPPNPIGAVAAPSGSPGCCPMPRLRNHTNPRAA